MSTPFLPPPPTNQTLVVAEFNRHMDEERRERRRRMPKALARDVALLLVLAMLFAASVWVGAHVTEAVGERVTEARAAAARH